MPLEQHSNATIRYGQQVDNSRAYLLPFIEANTPVNSSTKVLEIGTGEGGVLLPFLERQAYCVGVDLAPERIELSKEFLKDYDQQGQVVLMFKNVYDKDFEEKYKGFFDLIILKDVIEHIPNQEVFIPYIKTLLSEQGQIFFGFPPWYMPFGGHQQVCTNKWASKMPWYHILPKSIYRKILRMARETDDKIEELMEIKDTQITIERFERIIKRSGLRILRKQPYLINPIYKYKFGLRPRKQWKPLMWLPFFRNFVTTCVYYSVGLKR